MVRLGFTSDVHCDDFGSKIDPASGLNARWTDSIDMLRWVARDAAARGADALIVAGDLSESRHPAPWRVAQIGEAIAEFGGPVILARGNHDGLRAGRSIVDVLAAGRPDWSGFSRPGITVVGDTAVAVLPYLDKHHIRTLPGFETVPEAEAFAALGEAYLTVARGLLVKAVDAATDSTVLVVHQALAGGNMSDAQRAFLGDLSLVVDTRALAAIGFDAVLAGHFHLHQVLSTEPLVAYAGAPTRTDFGEEHQAKGYLIVDVDAGEASMEFVETPARRFVTLDFAADPTAGDDWPDRVPGAIVRVLNVLPSDDVTEIRRQLEAAGAFEVAEIRRRPVEAPESNGGLSETLTAPEALEAFFADDPDREVLVERGRALLVEVAA